VITGAVSELDVKSVAGSEGAEQPFFSTDGQWIGFFADRKLKKVPVVGGTPVTICDVGNPRGGAWTPDDHIVFGTSNTALFRVPSAGGTPVPLTALRAPEGSHRYPAILPRGRAVVFGVGPAISSNAWLEARIDVQSLDSGERRTVVPRGGYPSYVSSGHLLYVNAGDLQAVPFDVDRLEVRGSVIALPERLFQRTGINAGASDFGVSETGSVAYVTSHRRVSTIVMVDRDGRVNPLPLPAGTYFGVALSPDGTRLAYTSSRPDPDLFVYDLTTRSTIQLTRGGTSQWPVWTPDGRRIAFASTRTGASQLFWIAADGSGPEEQLTKTEYAHAPRSWSPDAQRLLLDEAHGMVGGQILHMQDGQLTPAVPERVRAVQGDLSPDGRWLAYSSNESGRNEVFIRTLSEPGASVRVSRDGGEAPLWNLNGGELFFRHDDDVMVVDVRPAVASRSERRDATLVVGAPRQLFSGTFLEGGWISNYDITPDGRRFVMIKPDDTAPQPSAITVALNWVETLPKGR